MIDRLEIWSDGNLPIGLRPADLKRDHLSRPRNPVIAEVFYRRGLVERWEEGLKDLVELCVRAGHPEPEFLEHGGAVCVRFLPSAYIAPHPVAHDLTLRQRKLLQALAGREARAFGQLRAEVAPEILERTLRDDLLHLNGLALSIPRAWAVAGMVSEPAQWGGIRRRHRLISPHSALFPNGTNLMGGGTSPPSDG